MTNTRTTDTRTARRHLSLLCAGLLPLMLLACSGDPDPAGQPGSRNGSKGNDRPAPVVLATAELRTWQQPVDGIATLRAQEAVLLTAPVSGRVEAVLFREGARVAAGTPLVRLEDDEEQAEFNAAQVNAELQASRQARMRKLREQGLLSQDELDTQSQAAKEAQARLELARVKLAYRTVKAPFAGVLGFRQVSPGTLVQPGDAIVSLDATDTLRAEFQVPETQLAAIAAGNAVAGRAAAYPGRTFKGTVTMVGSRVDENTRSVAVQARIDNRDLALKPGMLLTVSAQAKERQALFVPEAAIVPEGNRQFLWRVQADNTAARVEVALGSRLPGFVEITAGLNAGDRVVAEGHGNLRPGQRVQERTPGAPAPGDTAPAAAEKR
ncbi:MAG: efflux RND transporter periplasmic adaptor subunit [Pseudomonadota bacterium]